MRGKTVPERVRTNTRVKPALSKVLVQLSTNASRAESLAVLVHEKRLLITLSGGCFAPIGVLASVDDGQLRMRCRIVSLDGLRRAEAALEGQPEDAERLVGEMAEKLTGQGGRTIIEETRQALLG